jgi:hypothetical protein
MSAAITKRGDPSAIAEYKLLLKKVLDLRPSGTRQRLSAALGKNRSFVSQIANPAYPMPIPAQHLDTLFEVCHFSDAQKRSFLELYRRAHPSRIRLVSTKPAMRRITIDVPDLGDRDKNAAVDTLFETMAKNLTRITDEPGSNR